MPSIFTKLIRIVLSTTLIFLFADAAFSDEVKIGYINTERVFREAPAAILSSKKIEAEFVERDKEIQRLATDLASKQSAFTENSLTLSDAQRRAREFEINELAMTLKRRQREFKDDLQIRQGEANSAIIEKTNGAIKRVAESENLGMVLQDVVWASKSIDITDRVLNILGNDGK